MVWLRGADGCFPKAPPVISGRDGETGIDCHGIAIWLGETNQGITTP
jgi:hypothetical protein